MLLSRIRTELQFRPDPARKLPANFYDTYHSCVFSEKLLMMVRGTVRNMQSFIPKINFRNQCIQLVLSQENFAATTECFRSIYCEIHAGLLPRYVEGCLFTNSILFGDTTKRLFQMQAYDSEKINHLCSYLTKVTNTQMPKETKLVSSPKVPAKY